MRSFSPKTPTEEELFGFDFVLLLPAGVTIASALWFITVKTPALDGTTDNNPSAMLSGAVVINGSKVSQKHIGGVAGVQYCTRCQATTSDGQKIELYTTFYVQTACSA